MHAAGLYRDELAYPHLQQMGMEFDLPLEPRRQAGRPGAARVRELAGAAAGHAAPA